MSSLAVPFEAASASLLRRRLTAELLSRGVPVEVVDDATLVLSELVGNAVRHGSPLDDGGLRAGWHLAGDSLRLEVSDGGAGVPEHLPDRATRAGGGAVDDVESGRGLTIVGLVARSWGSVRTGVGATVWAELDARVVGADADVQLLEA